MFITKHIRPAKTKHLHNMCTTSAQRLRLWANIVQILYKCFVFAARVFLKTERICGPTYKSNHPSKNKTFVQHLYNVGPTSSTLVQHCINVIQIFCFFTEIGLSEGIGLCLVAAFIIYILLSPILTSRWEDIGVCPVAALIIYMLLSPILTSRCIALISLSSASVRIEGTLPPVEK